MLSLFLCDKLLSKMICNTYFIPHLAEYNQIVKQFGSEIKLNILLGSIWIKTVA